MPRPPGGGPGFKVRRQKIIDTAAELFARQGYAATSVGELGRAVGLAKGALYYYIDAAQLSREYCHTLPRGFAAPDAVLADMEARAAAFRQERPDLPLDPEAEWGPAALAS